MIIIIKFYTIHEVCSSRIGSRLQPKGRHLVSGYHHNRNGNWSGPVCKVRPHESKSFLCLILLEPIAVAKPWAFTQIPLLPSCILQALYRTYETKYVANSQVAITSEQEDVHFESFAHLLYWWHNHTQLSDEEQLTAVGYRMARGFICVHVQSPRCWSHDCH